MRNLSENFWKVNLAEKPEESRISWTVEYCKEYFQPSNLEKYRSKELEIVDKIRAENDTNNDLCIEEYLCLVPDTLKFLDVGTSFNPFKDFKMFEVVGIDIAPADSSVYFCDFLQVPVVDNQIVYSQNSILSLPQSYFNVIVFSLLLEYLPTSEQRITCCKKAYGLNRCMGLSRILPYSCFLFSFLELLNNGGILIIHTPDSKHQGANAKLMKNWRYTLSLIGFQRIKISKLKNLTCMVFRKSLKEVSTRWAKKYKEDYMLFALNIPQDFNNEIDLNANTDLNDIQNKLVIENIDFGELPGFFE
jgi:hypothetical protein